MINWARILTDNRFLKSLNALANLEKASLKKTNRKKINQEKIKTHHKNPQIRNAKKVPSAKKAPSAKKVQKD